MEQGRTINVLRIQNKSQNGNTLKDNETKPETETPPRTSSNDPEVPVEKESHRTDSTDEDSQADRWVSEIGDQEEYPWAASKEIFLFYSSHVFLMRMFITESQIEWQYWWKWRQNQLAVFLHWLHQHRHQWHRWLQRRLQHVTATEAERRFTGEEDRAERNQNGGEREKSTRKMIRRWTKLSRCRNRSFYLLQQLDRNQLEALWAKSVTFHHRRRLEILSSSLSTVLVVVFMYGTNRLSI